MILKFNDNTLAVDWDSFFKAIPKSTCIYTRDLYIVAQDCLRNYLLVNDKFGFEKQFNPKLLKPFHYYYVFTATTKCTVFNIKFEKKVIQFIGIGNLFPKCKISDEDAVKFLEENNIKTRTIGKNAWTEFITTLPRNSRENRFRKYFPLLSNEEDSFVRKGYNSGWMWYKYGDDTSLFGKGESYDVNSMFPWIMASKKLPFGCGIKFEDAIPSNAKWYVVRFRASFKLREGKFPFIRGNGEECKYLEEGSGEFTLVKEVYEMFLRDYEVRDLQIIDGYKYYVMNGLFNSYINKWYSIKQSAEKGSATREFAKLMLNNLYGKFGTNPVQPHWYWNLKDNGLVSTIVNEPCETAYVPLAAAITGWALVTTVNAALANADRFIAARIDSLLLEGTGSPSSLPVDNLVLGHWKLDKQWNELLYDGATHGYAFVGVNDVGVVVFSLPENGRVVVESLLRDGVVSLCGLYAGNVNVPVNVWNSRVGKMDNVWWCW